ncbi:hypothetical protein ACFSNO_30085 [Streptomyces cirratus]
MEMRKVQPGGVSLKDLPAFAEALVEALNAFFQVEHTRARDRKAAFNKTGITNPINQIGNMESAQAVYFRYFWMQALAVPAAWSHIAPWLPDRGEFDKKVGEARRMYLDLCIKQQLRALKTNQPTAKVDDLRPLAENQANSALKKALKDWFAVADDDFDTWLSQPVRRSKQGELDLDDAVADTE